MSALANLRRGMARAAQVQGILQRYLRRFSTARLELAGLVRNEAGKLPFGGRENVGVMFAIKP